MVAIVPIVVPVPLPIPPAVVIPIVVMLVVPVAIVAALRQALVGPVTGLVAIRASVADIAGAHPARPNLRAVPPAGDPDPLLVLPVVCTVDPDVVRSRPRDSPLVARSGRP